MCHVSCVMFQLLNVICQVSCVTCICVLIFLFCFVYKLVKLVGGGSVINGVTPSSFSVMSSSSISSISLYPQSSIRKVSHEEAVTKHSTSYSHVLHTATNTTTHWNSLHCTVLNIKLHCTALYCTALHCTALHFTALYCTVLNIKLHCTAYHNASLRCTAHGIIGSCRAW